MLTLLQGPPASGKSTLAKEMQTKNSKLLIVSRDAVRELLVPEHRRTWYTREDRKELEKVVDAIVTSAVFSTLKAGYDVVLDETNPDLKKWKGILDFLSEYEESHHVLATLALDTPIEECIRRDAEREYPVGESVIRRISEKLNQPSYRDLIGKRIVKHSGKPFPDGNLVNIPSDVSINPHSGKPAFVVNGYYKVDCERCKLYEM